ncbi:hypothetical protein [Streptomyces sp. NPDC048172]
MALTLPKLGDSSARSWWRVAAAAEGRTTMSWLYAQEAYQLSYGHELHG